MKNVLSYKDLRKYYTHAQHKIQRFRFPMYFTSDQVTVRIKIPYMLPKHGHYRTRSGYEFRNGGSTVERSEIEEGEKT